MFILGMIEESVENKQKVIGELRDYFYSQRIQEMPEDEETVWHTDEYHIPDEEIGGVLQLLADEVKLTWYVHAFSENQLFVVMRGKVFEIAKQKDDTWNEMIRYGIEEAKVEAYYLENISLDV